MPPETDGGSPGLLAFLGTAPRPRVEPGQLVVSRVSRAIGASVLSGFLDGLLDDRPSALIHWHQGLATCIPEGLAVPSRPGAPVCEPGEWDALVSLQQRARTLLGVVTGGPGSSGQSELTSRLALTEDLYAGALRRLTVPPGMAAQAAATTARAAGSLFGVQPAAPPR